MKVAPIPSPDPLVRWHETLARHGKVIAFTWHEELKMPTTFTLATSEHVVPITVCVEDAYTMSIFQGVRGTKTIIFGGDVSIWQRDPAELIERILGAAAAGYRPLVYTEGPYR